MVGSALAIAMPISTTIRVGFHPSPPTKSKAYLNIF